ncbi:MAG: hypothetical protein E7188_02535 [Erysipelotrichaceae bacterium]|nr:hypothetical protein [Erysipelotrichaceae bacterium]
MYKTLIEFIPKGKANAVPAGHLANVRNTTKRRLSEDVRKLRCAGVIIASYAGGYYIPATDDELLEYYISQRKHAVSELTTLKATRRELKRKGVKLP